MPESPFPPRCAHKFVPLRKLASGGFGHVWEAEQVGLGRRAAVKVLSASLIDDAKELSRFTDEARITASLDHPSIVVVLDHDVEDGTPWIAYELLPGASLRRRLEERGRLSAQEVADVGCQLASALEVVHAAGILHRDIKPDNVLTDEAGHWKLADFGIAKWSAARVKTRSGVILGTPSYVAPELILGQPAGPPADLYALGIVLYELLSGAVPFAGENIVAILQGHTSAAPPPLPAGTPRALAQVVERLLAKSPAERHASAAELHRELEPLVSLLNVVPARDEAPRRRNASSRTARAGPVTAVAATSAIAPPGRPRASWALGAAAVLAVALCAHALRRPEPVPSPIPSVEIARSAAYRAAEAALRRSEARGRNAGASDALAALLAYVAERPEGETPPPRLVQAGIHGLARRARDVWELREKVEEDDKSRSGELIKSTLTLMGQFEKLAPFLTDLQHGTEVSDAALFLHEAFRSRVVFDPLAAEVRRFATWWLDHAPDHFSGHLYKAALADVADYRSDELRARERALTAYRIGYIDTYPRHRQPEVLRAYYRQIAYLHVSKDRMRQESKRALEHWIEAMALVARLGIEHPEKMQTERLKLVSDVFKRGFPTFKAPQRIVADRLYQEADFAARLEGTFAGLSGEKRAASGHEAVEGLRYLLTRGPFKVSPAVSEAAAMWIHAECEALRLMFDEVDSDVFRTDQVGGFAAVRYMRLVDAVDAIAPLLFQDHLGSPWSIRAVFALDRMLQRGQVTERLVTTDPIRLLLPVWRARWPAAWGTEVIAAALETREKKPEQDLELRRAGFKRFKRLPPDKFTCEAYVVHFATIGEAMNRVGKDFRRKLVPEAEAALKDLSGVDCEKLRANVLGQLAK